MGLGKGEARSPPEKDLESEELLGEGERDGRREKDAEALPLLELLLVRSNLPMRERVRRISPAIGDAHMHE